MLLSWSPALVLVVSIMQQVLGTLAPPAKPRLTLDMADQGNFSLSVGGIRWLEGAPPAVHVSGAWWST
eukprot:SAG31_NODE_39941_length_284_cov_0.843243_1_plen_67_part_01